MNIIKHISLIIIYIYIYYLKLYRVTNKPFYRLTQYDIYNNLRRKLFDNITLTPITRVKNNRSIKLHYFNNFFSIFSI